MTSTSDDGRSWRWMVAGAGTAIGVASGFVSVQVVAGGLSDAQRLSLFLTNVIYWSAWSLLALLVIGLAWRVPLTGARRWRALALHAVCSVVFAAAHMAAFTFLGMLLRRVILSQPIDLYGWLTDTRWLTRWQVEWEITMYWAIVGLAHAMAFRSEGRERTLQAARLDAELSQARLQALQQQMHPHFLFNTLQSISVLMHHSVDAAEVMIERLGELLRGSLHVLSAVEGGGQSSTLVPLGRELDYVGHYLAIERMNLGDRLQVDQDIADDILLCPVPELLLQPLVENAVRHGIAPAARGGTVRISGRREHGSLVFEVSDDGVGPGQGAEGSGIAIQNTRRRLQLLYGDRHSFEISPSPGGRGLAVRITIPAADTAAVA